MSDSERPVTEVPMTWLRRNRWFLVALAVLIPAALVVSLIPRFFPYLENQPAVIDVARGLDERYSGANVKLTDLEVLDGEALNAPAGSDVVVATFAIDVVDPPASSVCTVTLVAPIDGVEREWDEAIASSDYEVPDEFEKYCDLSEARRYHLQLVFYVPRGEVPDPAIRFTSTAAFPQELRLH
ncbi:MAG: hypothetical protein ABIR17_04575 [Pseudolysinimonas sp.]|uniref:hypothetical protein n=1 Tax=Pseudolysinimonas sp. TaxID=2680009 RepID=UPI0032665FE4